MVISNDTNRMDADGDGANTTFPYLFRVDAENEILVTVVDSDNVSTELAFGTDYTLTGVGDDSGGDIETADPVAIGSSISAVRNVQITQETNLREQGELSPEVLEATYDRQVMMLQQMQEVQSRTLKIDAGFAATDDLTTLIPEAGKIIGWNDDGDGLENREAGSIDLAIPADGSVTAAKIAALAVTTAKINDLAVTAAKIADATITAAKLAATIISALTPETALASNDLIAFSDTSAGALRAATIANLFKAISVLTPLATPDTADSLALYDASATDIRVVTAEIFLRVINTLTADAAPDAAADYVATYDASATASKKVLISTLVNAAKGAAKAWVCFTVSGGVVTVRSSFNVTSVTRNGTGDFSITFTTAFSSIYYAANIIQQQQASQNTSSVAIKFGVAPTATVFRFETLEATGTLWDTPICTATFHGLQ